MVNNNNILWLLTARSGSKSIPNKNIKKLGNQPLLTYRIKNAINIPNSEIWISSDSEEYIKIAQNYGAKAMFIRPKELATDDASSIDVVLHAMNWADTNDYKFDFIGLLEPTSPFVIQKQLEDAVNELSENDNADHIVSVRRTHPNTYFIQDDSKYLSIIAKRLQEIKKHGRQHFKPQITPSGGFYISKWDAFKKDKTFYTDKTLAFEVDSISGLEIDYIIEWKWAEFILKEKLYHEK